MENPVLYNENVHFEHQIWKGEIVLWKDELQSFINRLSELITRWTHKEVLAQIGEYQKQFVLQESVIEEVLKAIEQQEAHLNTQGKKSTETLDRQFSKKHIELRKQMETHREVSAELKKGFFRFLEKDL